MKYIIKSIMKRIKQNDIPKPLGRWNIDYCNQKINNKVDLSNEDHCGPCGQYIIQNTPKHSRENLDVQDKNNVKKM